MHIEITDTEPHIDLADGKPFLSFYFTDAGPLEDKMCQFIDGVDKSDEECALTVGVTLKDILYATIDVRRFSAYPDRLVFDEKDRALFAAIKADLLAAVKTIDSFEYEHDS